MAVFLTASFSLGACSVSPSLANAAHFNPSAWPDQKRALSLVESSLEVLNREARTWFIVTTSQVRGRLSEANLRLALNQVQQRHACLNSCIVKSEGSTNPSPFHFAPAPAAIPLRIVKKTEAQNWQALVNQELNQPLDASQSLIRAVLVRDHQVRDRSYLIITTHHAISDGSSCMALHAELLSICQAPAQPCDSSWLRPSPTLPPATEQSVPASLQGNLGKLKILRFFCRSFLEQIFSPIVTLLPEQPSTISERQCYCLHHVLPPDLYQALLHRCRVERTTVHGALCAAMARAVLAEMPNQKRRRISCQSALDMRRSKLVPPEARQTLVNLASSVRALHTIGPKTAFWDLARCVKRKINHAIAQNTPFKLWFMGKVMVDYCLTHPNFVGTTLFISNMGRVDLPQQYGELELESISFAAATSLSAGVFYLYTSTFADQMQLNFMFSTPSFSPERMERLVKATIEQIWQAC